MRQRLYPSHCAPFIAKKSRALSRLTSKCSPLGRGRGRGARRRRDRLQAGAAFRSLGDPLWDTSSSQGRLLSMPSAESLEVSISGPARPAVRGDLTKILAYPRTRFSVSANACAASPTASLGALPAHRQARGVGSRLGEQAVQRFAIDHCGPFHRSVPSPSGSPSMVAFVIILGYSRYVCRWRF